MRLEDFEVDILKNFVVINPSIYFTKGNVVRTISPNETVEARAVFDNSFDRDFAIFDLKNFLSVLSLFENPEIELHEDHAVIKENRRSIIYNYADPEVINVAPEGEFDVGEPALVFRVTEDEVREISRAGGVLRSPELCFEVKGGELTVKTLDTENETNNQYNMKVDIREGGDDLTAYMRMEYYRLLEKPYEVSVFREGVVRFKNNQVEYWIPCEDNSTF